MKTYSMPCPIFEIGTDRISSVVDAIATKHEDGSVSISFAHPPEKMTGHIRDVDSLAEAKAQADAAREYLAR